MEERDGSWIAAMLAADANLEPGLAARPICVPMRTNSPTPA